MSGKVKLGKLIAEKIPGMGFIKRTSKKVSKTVWRYTPKDLKQTTAALRNSTRRGYRKGKTNGSIFSSVAKEYKGLKFSKEQMPALAASVTAMIPIPSPIPITPFVYILGKLIYKAPALLRTAVKYLTNVVSKLK